jgi:hypothetical protein
VSLAADPAAALARARRTPDAFLRAQALAHVAWHAAGGAWGPVAREAVDAAAAVEEPFQRAAVLAWPARVCLDRGHAALAEEIVAEALARAALIANPVSRADALAWLWDAVVPYPGPARGAVLPALVDACLASHSWKAGVYLREAALTLAPSDPEGARAVIAAMPDNKYRRQAGRRLQAGEFARPRWFFDPRGSGVD